MKKMEDMFPWEITIRLEYLLKHRKNPVDRTSLLRLSLNEKTKQVLNEVPERTFWTNEGEAGKFEKHYGHLKWIPADGPADLYMKSTATQKQILGNILKIMFSKKWAYDRTL